jgi:hypothetical protein
MARTVSGHVEISVSLSDKETSGTLSSTGNNTTVSIVERNSYGTSPAVTKQWSSTVALAGTAQTLDLTTLTGPRGAETFASVRAVYVRNKSTTAGHVLTVGNAASDAWTGPFGGTTHTVAVPAGGRLVIDNLAGTAWTVSGSVKNLKLDPGASTFNVDVLIIGS